MKLIRRSSLAAVLSLLFAASAGALAAHAQTCNLACSSGNVCAIVGTTPTCVTAQCASSGIGCPAATSPTITVTPTVQPAAQTTSGGALLNPLNATSLQQLLQEVLAYVVILGGIFLTIMLVYVGFLFVTAQGNQEKVSQARRALLWVVIGAILLLGAQAIATVITSTVSTL